MNQRYINQEYRSREGVDREQTRQEQVEQRRLSRKQQIRRRNAVAVWLGCLMGLLSGILIVIVAVKLYTNEMQRLEWSSQAVESRQISDYGYDRMQESGMQIRLSGVLK